MIKAISRSIEMAQSRQPLILNKLGNRGRVNLKTLRIIPQKCPSLRM